MKGKRSPKSLQSASKKKTAEQGGDAPDSVQFKKRAWLTCVALDHELRRASPLASALCAVIGDAYREEHGAAVLGDGYIAALLKCKRNNVSRLRAIAKRYKWIDFVGGSGRGHRTRYYINLDAAHDWLASLYRDAADALLQARDLEAGDLEDVTPLPAKKGITGEDFSQPKVITGEELSLPRPARKGITGETKKALPVRRKVITGEDREPFTSEPSTKNLLLPNGKPSLSRVVNGKAGGANALAEAKASQSINGQSALGSLIALDNLDALRSDDVPTERALEVFGSLYPKKDRDYDLLAIAFRRAAKRWRPKQLCIAALLWKIYHHRYEQEYVPPAGQWLALAEQDGIKLPTGCDMETILNTESMLAAGDPYNEIYHLIGMHMKSVLLDILDWGLWDDKDKGYAPNAWRALLAQGYEPEEIRDNLDRYIKTLPTPRMPKPGQEWKKGSPWLLAKMLKDQPWKARASVH